MQQASDSHTERERELLVRNVFPLYWDPSEIALESFRKTRAAAANDVQYWSGLSKDFGRDTVKEYARFVKETRKEALSLEKASNIVISRYETGKPTNNNLPIELLDNISLVLGIGYTEEYNATSV